MHSFDEDDRGHRQKRRRVSKACERCRHAKLKCNGARPQCDTCLKADKPCSYGAGLKRRGLRTGYVRALECLWGLVLQSINGSEGTIEKLIATTSNKRFWVRDDERDGLKAGETPWETWKASRIPQAIDALLSAHDNSEDEVPTTIPFPLSTQTEDPNPLWSPSEISSGLGRLLHSDAPEVICQRCSGGVHEQTTELPDGAVGQDQMGAEAPIHLNQTAQAASLELPPSPLQLLNRYFSFTHSWLPIVERHAVYRTFFAYQKNPVAPSMPKQDSGEIAVLWAIFAYTSMMRGSLSNEGYPAPKSSPHSDELYMFARKAVPLEKEDNYSTGHVQALLILGLLHYSLGEWDIARIVIGQATLLASRIGLDQADQCYTDHHRRTWLGCFVLDTLVSAHTGKIPWIRSNQVKTHLPISEAGTEEWEPWHLQEALLPGVGTEVAEISAPTHTLTVFTKLLELLCITNDSICSTTEGQKDGCREALTSWNRELPDHIRYFGGETSRTAAAPSPPNMLNLHIIHAYLRAELSHPTSARLSTASDRGKEWDVLIQAMEVFLGLFAQEAIPPSFDILRNILPRPITETRPILDLIAQMKNFSDSELADLSRSDHGGRSIITNSDLPPRNRSATNIEANAVTHNLSSQTEPDFGSLMNMSGSWLNGAAGFLESQSGPEDPCSQQGNLTALTASSGDIPSLGDFPDETTLGYLNYWDDIEIDDRDQLRRNLGFTV